jgi:putative Flp pilus-assembly TadE/G-like protein
MTRLRQSCGQAYVITVLFLSFVLVGMTAAVLDVGSWFRADRALQATVDAAALAGAQALPNNPGQATALAIQYANKNGGGITAGDVTISTTVTPFDTIKVDGSRPAPGFFAKIFGIDTVTVGAEAKARSGTPDSARWAAPIAVDWLHPLLNCTPAPCSHANTTLELEKIGPGAFRLINLDNSHGGSGPPILAEWIRQGFDGWMPLGEYYSDPGAKFNSSQVKQALDERLGTVMLFPIYDDTAGGGANFQYHVIGWVGFHIDSYTIQGSKKNQIHGHFTEVIWEGILNESAGNIDFGVHAVSLIE